MSALPQLPVAPRTAYVGSMVENLVDSVRSDEKTIKNLKLAKESTCELEAFLLTKNPDAAHSLGNT